MGVREALAKWIMPTRQQSLSFDEYLNYFGYNGLDYPIVRQTLIGEEDRPDGSFAGWANSVYKRNGIVYACMAVRAAVFSEATFVFRQRRNGRPGDLFSVAGDLDLLRQPWPNGNTQDLLARAIQDVDLTGNFFCVRRPGRIKRLRPDWVTIVMGSERESSVWDPDSEVIGYIYQPGGPGSGEDAKTYDVNEVAHFAGVTPDPLSPFRGMSWLQSIQREILADGAATSHKLKFFENGATPNMVVSLDATIQKAQFDQFVESMEAKHTGVLNAYKTLYLGGGAKVEVVGRDMQQLDFKATQGAGETRIAAAAGVPPAIVGLSEGLQGSTLNTGNFESAKRRFADITMRPLWRNIASSMATIISVPGGAELWYDDRDIPFLDDDKKDLADIQGLRSLAISRLVTAGYEPDAIVDAVMSDDLHRLVGNHTGLFSVQLQPPTTTLIEATPTPPQLEAGRSLLGPGEVRCTGCDKLLAEMATSPYRFRCTRCKTVMEAA